MPPIPRRSLIFICTFIPKGYWRCCQYPKGPSYMILILYPRVLAVPPIPQRPLIFISTFIPKGYWRYRQYPRVPSYLSLFSYPRGIGLLVVPPISQGPLVRDTYFTPEGIGGAANTPEVPQSYLSLLIVDFIETIINLEHMNLSMICLNQDIHMHLR
jgi:hypothetical protein